MYAAIDAVMTKIIMEKVSEKWSNTQSIAAGMSHWYDWRVGGQCRGCTEEPPSPLRITEAWSPFASNCPSRLHSSDEEEEDELPAGALPLVASVAGRVGARFEPAQIGKRTTMSLLCPDRGRKLPLVVHLRTDAHRSV